MIALMTKMILCLVAAILLGLLIGWLLSKAIQSKKDEEEVNHLKDTVEDRNEFIIQLEKEYDDEKIRAFGLKDQLNEKAMLLEDQSKQLTQMQQALNRAEESSVHENLDAKKHNHALVEQIHTLEKQVKGKEKEILALEEVLVKAEKTIEEKHNLFLKSNHQLEKILAEERESNGFSKELEERILKQDAVLKKLEIQIKELSIENDEQEHSISEYQKTIFQLEEELKLYSVHGEEDEFIISKDQFTHIEKQLLKYQKEIKALKEENQALIGKRKEEEFRAESAGSELDDIAIVKLFRDTYKKITKS